MAVGPGCSSKYRVVRADQVLLPSGTNGGLTVASQIENWPNQESFQETTGMTLGDWRLPTSKTTLGGCGEAGTGQASPITAQPTSEVGAIKAAIIAPLQREA